MTARERQLNDPRIRAQMRLNRTASTMTFLLIAYFELGAQVSKKPPTPFDDAYLWFVGQATPLAVVFTTSCLWYCLVPIAVAAIVLGALAPAWRARAFGSVALTLVMWILSDRFKELFHRPRPEHWVWYHEPSFSYSSGHALFATIVYGLWAWFVYRSDLPRGPRLALSAVLALWACGVVWSRLALGAHYPTDLIGGIVLGLAGIEASRVMTSFRKALA